MIKNEKNKPTWKCLNYAEILLIPSSTTTACVSIGAFASLVCVPIGITSFAIGIKICAITAGIKKYISIIKTKVDKAWQNSGVRKG